ncbi:MAG TPA: hypothetical protein VIU42_02360, partial [Xanthobacteraceae bacterium]
SIRSRLRKDGLSQRCALANNLPANAADCVKADHAAGQWSNTVATVKGRMPLWPLSTTKSSCKSNGLRAPAQSPMHAAILASAGKLAG